MYIVMLGKPGAGKGTVGKILSEKLGMVHISSGDLFRNYINNAGKLGEIIKGQLAKGKLISDDLTIDLLQQRLNEDDCKSGVILDGFPRTIKQAEALDKFLELKKMKIDMAIELDVSDEDIIKRITTRRICQNSKCREVYNLEFKNPKIEGICDKCGSKLIQRDDDKLETIKNRLDEYKQTTEKLVEYYRKQNALYSVKIDKERTSVDVAEELEKTLKK